jgi:ABC-2 type transport system ATP-binding protein
MMKVVVFNEVSKVYGQKKALNKLSFSIEKNKITGLIGRNGAGKTTLLKLIAGFIHETSGEVHVFSEKPFNNLKVSSNRIYIDDQQYFPNSLTLKDILQSASTFYVNWDKELADRLFDYFSFHPKQHYYTLSKGMKSTFNMIIGLAARCPLTILDEPTTGMDSSVRKDVYRALLKDYIDHPRTIILSSHLLNEIEDLLEDVLLIKDGEKRLHLPVADLKEYAIGINGKEDIVMEIVRNREILHQKRIGIDGVYVVVENNFTEFETENYRLKGVELTSVASDDLCTYLTSKTNGGIDDVFNRG